MHFQPVFKFIIKLYNDVDWIDFGDTALSRAASAGKEWPMAAVLYAEIHLLCIVIVWLCNYWSQQRSSKSASERWLHIMLIGFLVSFISNFLFTLVNRVFPAVFLTRHASWLLKTVSHAALCFGVFAWCGYADTECRGNLFKTRRRMIMLTIPLAAMFALIIANLRTHRLFVIDDSGYARGPLFHLEMGALVVFSAVFSVRLMIQSQRETDPVKRGHLYLMAAFPLFILCAWMLSRAGEWLPTICVAITVELLCLYMSATTQQISMDKLTQVNNRQNLLGYLDYKLVHHDENLFLFMMDLDYFKLINDNYGHLEGDDALVRAAKALKIACSDFRPRPYIARYGGDEFIVAVDATKPETDALQKRIRETLNGLNEAAQRPYDLTFSIGVAEYHPGMNANALIEAADAALYEVKRGRTPPPGAH